MLYVIILFCPRMKYLEGGDTYRGYLHQLDTYRGYLDEEGGGDAPVLL